MRSALVLAAGAGRALAGDADSRSLGLVDEIELLAGIDELVLRPGDLELRQRAAVEGALDRMIDDDEGAGHAHLELDDRRAAGRDQRRLHVVRGRAEVALRPDGVEDLADDVER